MRDSDTVMALDGTNNLRVEKLTSENYLHWKFNMKMYLMSKDLWEIVEGTETLPQGANQQQQQKFKKRVNQALASISLSVSTSVQLYVRKCKSGKEAWDALANHFEEKTLCRKVFLHRKLYSLRMSSETTMVDHVNSVRNIADQLESLDDAVSEKYLVMILLSSVPDDYNNLLTTLETLEEEKLTWDYVRDRLLTEFERRIGVQKKTTDPHEALFVGGGHGGDQRQYSGSGNGNNNYKKEFKCHYCDEKGHIQRNCEKKKADNQKKANQENSDKKEESASFCRMFGDFTPEIALHVDSSGPDSPCDGDDWYLDSACSQHMSGERDDLVNYEKFPPAEKHHVTLADESRVLADGQGDLNMHLTNVSGRKVPVVFRNVLYVPRITRPTALDIDKSACYEGCRSHFQEKFCDVDSEWESI